jgi:serine protease
MRAPRPIRRLAGRTGAAAFAAVALAAGMSVTATGAQASVARSPGAVNPYSPAYHHPYRHGVVPMIARQRQMDRWAQSHPQAQLSARNLRTAAASTASA